MTEQEKIETFKEIEKQANEGDVEALFKLGSCYYRSWGVQQDLVKAAELHFQALQNGYSEICYEKDGETFVPTLEELVEIYKQVDLWRIRYDYHRYYECYAGCGDDYSYGSVDDYSLFSPNHNYVKKIILDKDNNFKGVSISGRAYLGTLTPTLFVDGTIKGSNEYDDMCSRMDGPEDWRYRDKYTLVKKGQEK